MEKAFGYIRVSGKGQIKGDGLVRQEKAIREYSQAKGIEIVKIYRETGVSGTLANRPALAEMMVDLEENGHGVKTVVAEKLDRIARDLMIQETIIQDFRESGVELISVLEGADLLDNDPTRKLVRHVLGAIAEYEKAMLVPKLRVARERHKAKTANAKGGNPTGRLPLRPWPRSELAAETQGRKRKTYQEIAEELNREGISTLNRKPWNLQTVRHALNS